MRFPLGLFIIGIRPVDIHPPRHLSGKTVTRRSAESETAVVGSDIVRVSTHRASGLFGTPGDVDRQGQIAVEFDLSQEGELNAVRGTEGIAVVDGDGIIIINADRLIPSHYPQVLDLFGILSVLDGGADAFSPVQRE